MAVKAFKKIGRYEIIEELGRGSLGTVYKARDPQKDRIIRFKTLFAARLTPAATKSFTQLAKKVGAMSHDGLAAIYAVGEAGGKPFVTGEYFPMTASELTEETVKQPLKARLDICLAAARVLAFAHANKIVHTGLKPGNVGFCEGKVRIMDFGSGVTAKAVTPGDSTRSARLLDSLRYQPPEVLEGHPPDERSDIYAVGILLYELLTHEKPFRASSVAAVVKKVINQQIRALTRIDTSFPPALDAILARSLARLGEGRYQSMVDLIKDLERVSSSLPEPEGRVEPVKLPATGEEKRKNRAQQLAEMVLKARQLYGNGRKKECREIMTRVEAITSDESANPGLAEMVKSAVDELTGGKAGSHDTGSRNLYNQAHALHAKGEYARCLAVLQELFAGNPDHRRGRALALAAQQAMVSGKLAAKGAAAAKTQASELLKVGRTALSRGDLQTAETLQRALEGVSPEGPEIKEIRASLSEARLAALRALPDSPQSPAGAPKRPAGKANELRKRLKTWLRRAGDALASEQFVEAISLAFEVIKVDPSRLEALDIIERSVKELRGKAHERTLVSIELPKGKKGRRKR